LLIKATPRQHRILFASLEPHQTEATKLAQAIYEQQPSPNLKYEKRNAIIKRQAYAVALLFALNEPKPAWNTLKQEDDPELTAFLEKRLSELVLNTDLLNEQLGSVTLFL
jgi:hypothetical protein